MAVWSMRFPSELGDKLVLAPERYDPRRKEATSDQEGTVLGEVVTTVRRTVTALSSEGEAMCLVLDTSHAQEGVIKRPSGLTERSLLGSAKKVIEPGDVIVSRLRPYLRQVAFVDENIPLMGTQGDNHTSATTIVCSTEFFVLRGRTDESIAFLVPLLLSAPVQAVLAAAQEGGHHPRFNENTLLRLRVPSSLLNLRMEMSNDVVRAIELYREAERIITGRILECNNGSAKAQ